MRQNPPLHIAAEKGHIGIVKYLIVNGAEVNAKNENETIPLHIAAEKGHTGIVEFLIENEANVSEKNKDGWTPLHIAAEKGHIGIVKYLIVNGAEVNAKNENETIPLHIAAEKGHTGIVEFLIENEANVSEKNKDGWTPLHIAAEKGHIGIVRLLVESKANIDKKNKDGRTPLHIAAEKGHIDVLEFLVENGANVNLQDRNEYAALGYFNHYPKMQRFLFMHGAIPQKELLAIAQDIQSVHDERAVARAKFITKNLVELIKADKNELKQAAENYLQLIKEVAERYKSDSLRLKLLALIKGEKKDVMKEVLDNDQPVPDDDEFIRIISKEAEKALEEKYLRKNVNGEYDLGLSSEEFQYDDTKHDAKVTIPETIGYIKLLIDKIAIPTEEKKELLATFAEQNPKSVEEKLSKIREELKSNNISRGQITNKKEFYQLLENIDDSKIGNLFKEVTGLNMEEIWKEQKYITLMKQIYVAATTYAREGYGSACGSGVWAQITSSVQEIDLSLNDKYAKYREDQKGQEKLSNAITEGNIEELVSKIANELIEYVTVSFKVKKIADELSKHIKDGLNLEKIADDLSKRSKDNLEVKKIADDLSEYIEINKGLLDLTIANINIDKPEEVTSGQVEILKKVNQGFIEHIEGVLPKYSRVLPTREEYKIIIDKFPEILSMQKFSELFDIFLKLTLINDALLTKIEKPSQVLSVQGVVYPLSSDLTQKNR
nr:unnamed protein product [Callosobruchus chinensis]